MIHRPRKKKRSADANWTIQQEIANAQKLHEENIEAMGVLSKAIANEPKSLTKAFEKIEQEREIKK